MTTAEWEAQTGHRALVCTCERAECSFCNGGLVACRICGGVEGSLLPYCPGRRLPFDEDERNYHHYCAGTGPFARLTFQTIDAAKTACYYRLHPNPYVSTSRGARGLYDAVCELWRIVF